MPFFISFLSGTASFYVFRFFPVSVLIAFICITLFLIFIKRYFLIAIICAGFVYAFILSPVSDLALSNGRKIVITGHFKKNYRNDQGSNSINRYETFIINDAHDYKTGKKLEPPPDGEVHVYIDFPPDYKKEYRLLIKTDKEKSSWNPATATIRRFDGSVLDITATGNTRYSVIGIFGLLRNQLNDYFLKTFKPDTAAFISSITTGNTSMLSDRIRESFNRTGLAHILSISGTHFGLFSFLIFEIILFFIKRLPYKILLWLTLYATPSQYAAIICLPFMLFYLGISGSSVPAVRSFVMISLFLSGLLISRKGYWLNSLFFAAFLLSLWDPKVILSLSFQLSFLAVIFIGYAVENINKKGEGSGNEDISKIEEKPAYKNYIKKLKDFFITSLKISLSASLGTAPLVAYYFHYFSLISPVSNLLIAPVIGFLLIPFSLISSLAFIFSGSFIFRAFIEMISDISLSAIKYLSDLTFADIKIPAFSLYKVILFYLCFFICIASGRKIKPLFILFVSIFLFLILSAYPKKDFNITFVDVGQGDSAIVELPDKKILVIDTGRTGRETAGMLKYLGTRKIDVLILTHSHPDHSGGLGYLLDHFSIKEVWDNGRIIYPEGLSDKFLHRRLQRGDSIQGNDYSITVLHPYRGYYINRNNEYSEENNSSLVLKITGKKYSYLFTGDIEEDAEKDIANLGHQLRSCVMKAPHHGSITAANEEFIRNVSPSITVISAGRHNRFGHPDPEFIKKLTSDIYRTDIHGAIKITETTDGLIIKTFRDYAIKNAEDISQEIRNIKLLFSAW